MPSVLLACHPFHPCESIQNIRVSLNKVQDELWVQYRIEGDISALSLPEPALPQRADDLWRNTCCELFLKRSADSAEYFEFNFSPSTEWAIYRFEDYRRGMSIVPVHEPPRITVQRTPNELSMNVTMFFDASRLHLPSWRLGLSSVIKEKSGSISYWAYALPPGKSDFHHSDSFALELPFSDAS